MYIQEGKREKFKTMLISGHVHTWRRRLCCERGIVVVVVWLKKKKIAKGASAPEPSCARCNATCPLVDRKTETRYCPAHRS